MKYINYIFTIILKHNEFLSSVFQFYLNYLIYYI
jgi:hypothetical protein